MRATSGVLPKHFAGRYIIERELGRGGTAVVYLARDSEGGRMVAIKALRSELSESLSAERFLREIRVTQGLQYPDIIPILDAGAWNGTLYCILPYMDGGTLRDRLRRHNQMPVADVVGIGVTICAALAFAHERKLIHRDVKPENILFTDNHACLADFGIARALEDANESTTSTGVVRGTPAYMSPEQASGDRKYDGRSDIYSLACVLYEAIAGMPAFVGPTSQAVLAQRLVHPPRPLNVYRPTVPPALQEVLERALAVAPADRFQTAAEFGAALAAAPASETAESRARAAAARSTNRAKRVRRAAVAVPLVGVALAAVWELPATRSMRANQAFDRGYAAIAAGEFTRADSELFRATRLDAGNARALTWLALLRSWVGSSDRPTQWTQLTAQATKRRSELAPSDSLRLDGLLALGGADFPRACSIWSQLIARDSADFTAWYGLGNCLRSDSIVVRDGTTPARWRFRSSYEQAIRAYERAFALRPALLHVFGGRSLGELQNLLYTGGATRRRGRAAAPDTGSFRAYPVWQRDTMAFLPIPTNDATLVPLTDASVLAIHQQRRRFQQIARMWRDEDPQSADALEAVAIALEMLGNDAALDTLRLARSRASDRGDRLRIAAGEVLLAIKFALPSDTNRLRAARALADSLLLDRSRRPAEESQLLAILSALTGRAFRAAGYAADAGEGTPPPAIAQSGPTLRALSALGGPSDSLRSLERIVETALQALPASERSSARREFLLRPAALAFPDTRLESLHAADMFTSFMSWNSGLAAAAAAGNGPVVHATISELATARRGIRPSDVTVDALLLEASALRAVGDAAGAIRWLDPTLDALRLSASQDLARLARAGPLVRTMVLRADLAALTEDSATARKWARAVVILWSDADPFLQVTVQRMQRLSTPTRSLQ